MTATPATATASDPAAARRSRLAMQARIESEITTGGLQHEAHRLDEARANLDFYRGNFTLYPPRLQGSQYDKSRYNRYSLICQRIINVLTANLYASGPARELPDHPEAQAWLAQAYRANAVDAIYKEADRVAAAGEVAALQVAGLTSEDGTYDSEIEVQLWDASQFTVWLDRDKPTRPVAVAVLDAFDCRRRLRLWTLDECVTFATAKLLPGQTTGGTAYRLEGRQPNPYGVLPFAFFHWQFPTTDFWSGSPGTVLRNVNDYINFFMTEQGDCIRYNARPVVKGRNLPPGWRPPTPIQPGDFWELPPGEGDATDPGNEPDVDYLQADLSFISGGWEDLSQFVDRTLQDCGIPGAAIRMEAADATSGAQVVAEQVPLILWARGRQPDAGRYEADLARVCLKVGAAHLRANGLGAAPSTGTAVAALEAAAAAPGLVLRWPEMFPDLPGPGRDQEDDWLLERGLTSRIRLLMKRQSLSRDEAIAALRQVGEDRTLEESILGPLTPPPAQQAPAADVTEGAADDDAE